ncbi:hypothetical protein B0H19DRAFT_1259344 [Mycena capillaripes]|nr:hypothetical protein B0H19DRAFT_1259344 [Mycena capillaripes]
MPGVQEFGSISPNFFGCVATIPDVFDACCAEVGSAPVAANDTCGCPYNAVFQFTQADIQKFVDCAGNNGSATLCHLPEKDGSGGASTKTMGWGGVFAVSLAIAGVVASLAVE